VKNHLAHARPDDRTPERPALIPLATTFEELGVSHPVAQALAMRGIEAPFAIQTLVIADALAGSDVLAKSRTGSGKTLAFAVPIVERIQPDPKSPTALILTPTRELASQVTEDFRAIADVRRLQIAAVYGGVGLQAQAKRARSADILIATPGRLLDLVQRRLLRLDRVRIAVLDEADRMLDMGFLPDVTRILQLLRPDRQTMLFSATLDGAVKQLVKRYMHDPVFHEVESDEPTVEEMEHRFLYVHDLDKVKVAAAIARGGKRTLMFCNTKRMADRLVRELKKEGVTAAPIHGDLGQAARERSLADFQAGKVPVLVATDVAARGIHVDSVDVVVHYDPTDDHKAYLHRSGRTARAGEAGVAVTLMRWNEENYVRTVQRRLGLSIPIVEVFSNDPRLADLHSWDPSSEAISA
jgi:superfamily II DNA/RNA helicase